MKNVERQVMMITWFFGTAVLFSLVACRTQSAAQNKASGIEVVQAGAVKVGISWSSDKIDADMQLYADGVAKAGGQPVFLPQFKTEEEARKALERVDAVIVTGGEDISPALYNEEPDKMLGEVNGPRDISDIALIKACILKDMPALVTCRGMQLTNALCGGSLYQDLPTQYESSIVHRDPARKVFVKHQITLDKDNLLSDAIGKDGEIEVNSWHHQAVKKVGKNLKIIAKAPDGIIEAMIKTDNSYYILVQFHPEVMISEGNEMFLNLYKDLIKHGKKHQNQ